MLKDISRRTVLKTLSAGVAASTFPSPFVRRSFASDPILLGLPISRTAMAGVADHQDYLNGTTLALEEINAAGGVLGREIKPVIVDFDVLSPESGRVAINSLVDAKVHAISTAFTFTPIRWPMLPPAIRHHCCGA